VAGIAEQNGNMFGIGDDYERSPCPEENFYFLPPPLPESSRIGDKLPSQLPPVVAGCVGQSALPGRDGEITTVASKAIYIMDAS